MKLEAISHMIEDAQMTLSLPFNLVCATNLFNGEKLIVRQKRTIPTLHDNIHPNVAGLAGWE